MSSAPDDPALHAWVNAADGVAAAEHAREQAERLADAPSYLRDILNDDDEDILVPDEEWPTPYGPDLPPGAPAMLLDVDGALSPFVQPDDGAHWPRWEPHQVDAMGMPMAPAMGEAIAALGVQIVWLTTWNERANTDIAPLLGWEPQPVLNERAGHRFKSHKDEWSKLHVVKRWLRTYGPRPLVWVDDDPRIEALVPHDPHVAALPHLLLVRTDRNSGITPADVTQIQDFLAGLPAPAGA